MDLHFWLGGIAGFSVNDHAWGSGSRQLPLSSIRSFLNPILESCWQHQHIQAYNFTFHFDSPPPSSIPNTATSVQSFQSTRLPLSSIFLPHTTRYDFPLISL